MKNSTFSLVGQHNSTDEQQVAGLNLNCDIKFLKIDDSQEELHGELTEDVQEQWCEQLLSESIIDKVLEVSLGSPRLGPLWGAIFVAFVYGAIMFVGAIGNIGSALVSVCISRVSCYGY